MPRNHVRRNTERQTGECWSWRRGRAGGPAGGHCRARHRTAHAHAPPGWLLRLSVLDQTRPTSSKPRSCTSLATLRAGCGQAGHPQRSPAPNGQTEVPAGTEAPAHEAHGPSSRGGLGGAHVHPGPSRRPRSPRHAGTQSPARRHAVPVTQAHGPRHPDHTVRVGSSRDGALWTGPRTTYRH